MLAIEPEIILVNVLNLRKDFEVTSQISDGNSVCIVTVVFVSSNFNTKVIKSNEVILGKTKSEIVNDILSNIARVSL